MRISDWSSDVCSSDLGGLVGAALAGGVVLQIPLGRWSDLIDRRAVIAAAAGAAAVVAVATALVGSDRPAAVIALVPGAGGTTVPLYSLSNAHLNDSPHTTINIACGARTGGVLRSGK